MNKTQHWRIRTHLAVLVLAVAVPVTALLAYTIATHQEQALTDANQTAFALAKISAINTGNYIQNRQDVLARLAERPLVRALDADRCDPILKDFRDFDDGFSNVVVLNGKGLAICSAIPLSRRLSYADGNNFKQVMATNDFVVGKPSFGKISNKWILPLAYPVQDEQGHPKGLIGAAVDLARYTPLPMSSVLPEGTTAALLNSDGIVLAHSHAPDKWIGNQARDTRVGQTVLRQANGRARLPGLEGQPMLLGFSEVPGSDWYTLIGIPTKAVLAQAHRTTLFHSLLLIVILIAAAGIAYMVARRIEQPIRSIAATAKRVASGDLNSRLTTTGPAEIAVVATEFNQMVAERQQAEEQLRETAEHLHLAMRAARMGSWEWDIRRDLIYCSHDTGPMFGLANGSTFRNYDDFLNHVHTDDRAHVQHAVIQSLHSDLPFHCEYRVIWPDNSEHWITASAQLVRDTKGRPERMLGICMDITERMQSDQQMRYLASHDALTELVNRREFEQRLSDALLLADTGTCQHAVLYMDLDQFKLVNDTCGHVAGDELLRQLASLLQQQIRETDTLARLGGDEFVVLLEHCPLQPAQRIAEQLRQTVTDFNFVWEEKSFKVGASIGLVPITDNKLTLEQILSAADAACFVAKDQGRNRIHVHDTEDTALAQHHGQMEWVSRIHTAMDEDRFCLYGQTIMPLNSQIQPHCELLLRMQDSRDSVISPMAFIPAAERYGLMPNIDRWVIATALRTLARHGKSHTHYSVYNINLSGTSLADKDLLGFIHEAFRSTGIDPHNICFEITETAAIANLPQAMQLIANLKNLGCHIALDDFGSGMSSFTYLKNLKVDYLKIDGSFVRDMTEDPIDRAMVESINNIGHVMHIETIAESVENERTLAELQHMGVDFVQGYDIAAPVPLEYLLNAPAATQCNIN